MKNKPCEWCDTTFETKISYQIYCSATCREAATREKISARYQITRRTKLQKKVRVCKSCGSNLSVYNDDVLCNNCIINPKEVARILKQIKGMANGKDWKD
jgi:hypothetical protein